MNSYWFYIAFIVLLSSILLWLMIAYKSVLL